MTAGHIKFDWNRYISFAEELLEFIPEDKDDEAKERCGISRAYYGAFHRAKSYLNRIGITIDINGSDSHKKVIEEYKNVGIHNRLWYQVGIELDRLKKQSKKADYHDKYFDNNEKFFKLKNQLKSAILKACWVIEKINEIEEQDRLR